MLAARTRGQHPHIWTTMLFFALLALGIFARLWEYGALPPGLNVDEASIGVEAYYTYKFGMDRNGMSYPIHFISWGSGQNAPYAYVLIPFVVLGGLDATSIRLPMLLAGILSLPLMYFVGKRLLGGRFGLLAMFLMAVSPWHIINSRWAVESNLFPFVFLAGFAALLLSDRENHWFLAACVLFAGCLYTYGTAYVAVPVFLGLAVPGLLRAQRVRSSDVMLGLLAFLILAVPILLFIGINSLQLNTIHLGPVTIPRLPVEARYESMAAVFGDQPLRAVAENIGIMLKLLWTQADAYPWNHIEPFGYFYTLTFPLAAIGFLLTIPFQSNRQNTPERWLLFAWMAASLLIGLVHPVNLTRLNLIFTPILLCIAVCTLELDKLIRGSLVAGVCAVLVGFIFFTLAYHGEDYEKRTSGVFNAGIIPAIDYATESSESPICFTEATYSAYIYVLLTQRMHPHEYIDRIEWLDPIDPVDPARTPRALGRYRFRLADCADEPDALYILTLRELPPDNGIEYRSRKFAKFQVYLPKK